MYNYFLSNTYLNCTVTENVLIIKLTLFNTTIDNNILQHVSSSVFDPHLIYHILIDHIDFSEDSSYYLKADFQMALLTLVHILTKEFIDLAEKHLGRERSDRDLTSMQ